MKRGGKILALGLAVMLCLSGCGYYPDGSWEINNLEGRTIGTALGRGPVDYILAQRDLMDLYKYDLARYQSTGDYVLALRFHKIEALALEEALAYQFVKSSTTDTDIYHAYESPFGEQGMSFTVSPDNPLKEEFNAFLEDFHESEEYEDIQRRIHESKDKEYEYREIENIVTTDREIKVAFREDYIPYSCIDMQTREIKGVFVEIMTMFANSIGAKLVIEKAEYPSAFINLSMGKIDMLGMSWATAGKEVYEMSGQSELTDSVIYTPLYFVTLERRRTQGG